MTTQNPPSSDIPDPNVIKTIPGHIVYASADAAALGDTCIHIWILADAKNAKCVHCEGTRVLEEEEVALIEHAEAAGVQFLRWPERFDAMSKARGRGRRQRRKDRKRKRKPGAPRGITNVQAQVPETHVSIRMAAQALGIEPKKLRKKVRGNPELYEAVKVGRQVYIKIPEE